MSRGGAWWMKVVCGVGCGLLGCLFTACGTEIDDDGVQGGKVDSPMAGAGGGSDLEAGAPGGAGAAGQAGSGGAGGSGAGNDSGGAAGMDGDGAAGTGAGGSGGATAGSGSAVPNSVVPDSVHCAPVADWDPEWEAWEDEVLVLVNQQRMQGATCGGQVRPPAAPLASDPALRCAARLHSLDMFERDFWGHTNPDGTTAGERMRAAGFTGRAAGENIARGQRSPEAVMTSWMGSSGHCNNIMNASNRLIGIGYHGGRRHWTQNFGR